MPQIERRELILEDLFHYQLVTSEPLRNNLDPAFSVLVNVTGLLPPFAIYRRKQAFFDSLNR